jgi:hypothetical protein
MNNIFYIFIILTIILILFNFINNLLKIENFLNITTWKPYIIDVNFQPGYSNYFYKNGYMYPIY